MTFFKKSELKGIIVIFIFLAFATYLSFLASYRRERDTQRNLDVSAIAFAIEVYKVDYGIYPLSNDSGEIIACKGSQTYTKKDESGYPEYRKGANKPILENLVACEWGNSKLLDINDINYPNYLTRIPDDPRPDRFYYFYYSDGESFRIYGHFEGKTQKELDENVAKLGISCGDGICNFGKGSKNSVLTNPLP